MHMPLSQAFDKVPEVNSDLRLLGLGLNECERELLDCFPVVLHEDTYARLFATGISGDAVNGCGAFDALHVEPVIFRPRGRFEFSRNVHDARGHLAAIIIPVRDECADLIDLGAWTIDNHALALWRGVASMFGASNVFAPRLGEPLVVHETVLEWLRSGRRGVFVIDPKRAAPLLHIAQPLGVTNEAFGRRLQTLLTIQSPQILVATTTWGVV